MKENYWHAQDTIAIFDIVKSNKDGLTEDIAKQRLNTYGPNELEQMKHMHPVMRFLKQFHNILIYILLVSAAITIVLQHFVDASVILGVVILNAIFGFIQEGKAEKAIEAIRAMLAPNANVIREGKHQVVPANLLVIGDVVSIKSGDKVPADLRLIEVKNLQIQEAILTGESNAIEKTTNKALKEAPVGDRTCMAYSGTSVTYGKGTGIVIATGINTEIGKIGGLLKTIKPLTTPLLEQLNSFGKWLALAIVILAVFTFAIGVWIWHEPAEQTFMAAVGLAVAAIPEGLPPILTIILAIGVTRMARRNAIIRQLPAVETMGAVTTICTDKTGTLTRNEQIVKNIITSKNSYSIEEDTGVNFYLNNILVDLKDYSDLSKAIKAGVLCNDGEFSKDSHSNWHIHGNPIDKALLEIAAKIKIDLHLLQADVPRTDLIPYESEHKFMATLHHTHNDGGFIYIKGAPEKILMRCSYELNKGKEQPINMTYWQEKIELLAAKGYRVIAIATKKMPYEKNNLLFNDVQEGLNLVALFGLIDAPRIEAAQAVAQCYTAGIKVKMITGDHATTAKTIASQVGIDTTCGVLNGSELDNMDDTVLSSAVKDVNVYARTSPHHKLRLIKALQKNGELVAMTGDGVNDAPALRKANIGVAMGHNGSEIAKESAAMVLADDNFATIVHAIEEGRTVYDNLKKVILLIVPTNAAEAFTIVVAVLFGLMLPITPVQILWVNMITAVTLAMALGFEKAENNLMARPPRKTKEPILSGFLVWRIVFVTLLLVASVFGLFLWEKSRGVDVTTARTIAVNMLVMGEAIYLLNCRKLYNSVLNVKNILASKPVVIAILATVVLQLFFTYLPFMQHFFGTTAISLMQWLYIIFLSISVFLLVEIEKLCFRCFILKK